MPDNFIVVKALEPSLESLQLCLKLRASSEAHSVIRSPLSDIYSFATQISHISMLD